MYEIPKIAVAVVIHMTNDESVSGSLWITEQFISASGRPLIEDFLNQDGDNFFSFESDMGAFRLINKAHITYIETNQDDRKNWSQARNVVEPNAIIHGVATGCLTTNSSISDSRGNTFGIQTGLHNGGPRFVV